MFKGKSLKTFYLLSLVSVATATLLSLSLVWTTLRYSEFQGRSREVEDRALERRKARMRSQVESAVASIDLVRDQAVERLRRSLAERTGQAVELLRRLHAANPGLSAAALRGLLVEALRSQRFNGDRGYYFVFDTRGNQVLAPLDPEQEGKNVLDSIVGGGRRLHREMIALIRAQGGGFVEYAWKKPGRSGTDHRKLSHVAYFEPLDWVVGTGEYLEDVEADLQDETLERLSRTRFGPEGYLFGVREDGGPLFTNGRITRGTANILAMTDADGVPVVREEIRNGLLPGGGFFRYQWPRLGGGPARPKLSYVLAYKPWGWIIGAGEYLDDLGAETATLMGGLRRDLNTEMLQAGAVFLFVLAGILLVTTRLSRRLRRELDAFARGLAAAPHEGPLLDAESLEFPESRSLARALNSLSLRRDAAMAALKASEETWRLNFEAAPVGIFLLDAEGTILEANPAGLALFRAGAGDLAGRPAGDLLADRDQPGRVEHSRQLAETRTAETVMVFRRLDGTVFRGLSSTARLADGRLLSFCLDVTERERNLDALKSHVEVLTRPPDDTGTVQFTDLFDLQDIQALQDAFAEACEVASIITRPDGTPLTRPSRFCRLCSEIIRGTEKGRSNCFRSDAFLGRHHPGGPKMRTCLSGGLWDAGAAITVGGRHVANWLIGQVRNAEVDESAILAYGQEIGADPEAFRAALAEVPVMSRGRFEQVARALYLFSREISERAYHNLQQARLIAERGRQEEALRQAKELAESSSRAKGEFLANMSHEIRTPLNGLLAMLQLLETTGMTPEQEEYVGTARLSGQRLTRLLSDILDLSRIDAGKMVLAETPFRLSEVLESVNETFLLACREKGLALRIQAGSELPDRYLGDELRLRQVLYNLVGNAVKFTDKGWVELAVTLLPDAPQGFARLGVTVADSGIGIPAEARGRIFESFTQAEGSFARRYQGAGLGLSIVKSLVELMGGDLGLDSEPGRGTTFRCSLVLRLDQVPARGAVAGRDQAGPQRSLRILLAEDDRVNQIGTKRLLEKLGHRVTVASDGNKALEALEREDFDCVLLDIQMPVLDGLATVERIRDPGRFGDKARVPVIALTAHAMSGDRERFLAAGMDDYLSKPLDRASLERVLARVAAG